jgi:hypothetical protein
MAVAGLVELWLGVAAEQRPLEELALPLTVADAERDEESTGDSDGQPASAQGDHRQSGHGEGPAAGAV